MNTFGAVIFEVGKPSIRPPYAEGTSPKRIVLTREAVENSLSTIINTPLWAPAGDLSTRRLHSRDVEIGIIKKAYICGKMAYIEGPLFPEHSNKVLDISASSTSPLGMSFDSINAHVEDMYSYILKINEITFIGATVVPQHRAAFGADTLFWTE